MSIPYWRVVYHSDDGCTVFGCLNCYNTWESRTPPIPHDWYGNVKEKEIWKYCPYCATEWKGKYECKEGRRWGEYEEEPMKYYAEFSGIYRRTVDHICKEEIGKEKRYCCWASCYEGTLSRMKEIIEIEKTEYKDRLDNGDITKYEYFVKKDISKRKILNLP
tara:strand:- start:24205 stop:24690 length:486 start_codon:yes stop_codon:yes gene_type:complete